MQVDVIICTRTKSEILPELLHILESASWVKSLIVEDSKPLSLARINAARKASGTWIAYIDADVLIPTTWFSELEPYLLKGVVAVDSRSYNWNVHEVAYNKMFERIQNRIGSLIQSFMQKGWDNRAYLVRRDIVLSWNPVTDFYSEDEDFYNHAIKHGRWIQLPFSGVKHLGINKSYVPFAYNLESLDFYRLEGKHKHFTLLKLVSARLVISFLAMAYSNSLKTFLFHLRFVVHDLAGTLMARMDRLW